MKKEVLLKGFSLLEVSISLLIMGVVSSVCISQLNSVIKLNASQKTYANLDFVVRAIGAYYINSDAKIPYPSNDEKDIGYADQGMQGKFGIVPYKTLGIMEKFAKNGNGQWFLYKINPYFGVRGAIGREKQSLGIDGFESAIAGDKVAIIIKSVNSKGGDEYTVWYSEKTFAANYGNNLLPKPLPNGEQQSLEKNESGVVGYAFAEYEQQNRYVGRKSYKPAEEAILEYEEEKVNSRHPGEPLFQRRK